MNKAKADLNRTQEHKHSSQPRSNPHASVTARADDAVRDFFRRGDRGQYEGGKADRNLESMPTWDMPERPQIVRTPRQQARRAVLMRVEAIVIAACLILLVTAARLKSHDGSEKQTGDVLEGNPQPAELLGAKPVQNYRQQLKPPPAPVVASNAVQLVPPTANVPPVQPRDVKSAPAINLASGSAPAVSKVDASAAYKAPKAPAAWAGRTRQTQSTESNTLPSPVSTSNAVAPRRAVAAFPDD